MVITSEVIKLRSLRSNVWLLVVAAASILLLGPIQSVGQIVPGAERSDDTPIGLALTGASLATLLAGVLGVLTVTGEYAPRSIRTTFTLVPRRERVVLAKAVALAGATALAGTVAVAVAVPASLAILGSAGIDAGPVPEAVRASAAMIWYLVGWGVLGQVAGWVTRSKIGGAALLVGVMTVLPLVLSLLPGRVGEILPALMPSSAGSAMIGADHALMGFLLWTAYLVGFTALSAWLVSRRDA
ncbi:ABC transporter permease subunit [Actinoplanes sp. NPDC051633]|uniref:ABC transporter permease subunit n=1 Tax=Actinoplanes sp. NPDC051633 TaxID=3155670 RepID=UPI00341F2696